MRVLIVDDEESLLTSLGMAFGESGFGVTTARSVPGAVARLQSEVPDVVIVDKNLPNQSGTELVKYIRENHGDLPVLMITAYATASNAKEMLNLGIDGYVEKPFSSVYGVVSDVREAIKKCEARKKAAEAPTGSRLLVISTAAPAAFQTFGLPFEVAAEPSAISAALAKDAASTVLIDSTSFPAQETVGLVGVVRRQAKKSRIVVFSDVALKVPILKNLIGAGVDNLAETEAELRAILCES